VSRPNPVDVAKNFVTEKYPDCQVAFVAGSFNRGEETSTSDIDLIVLFSKVEQAWRESLNYQGWPVEVFLHDLETIKYFIDDDAKSGIPSLANMINEAVVIHEKSDFSAEVKDLAKRSLSEGPPVWTDDDRINFRYTVSDLLDDLKDPRTTFEGLAITAKLHGVLSFFLFRSQRQWAGAGKHIPRQLQKQHPQLFPNWEVAFTEAFRGNFKSLVQLTDKILSENGGYLFDGYKRTAPKEWRVK
jgi:predicted nucleotidyltransferase